MNMDIPVRKCVACGARKSKIELLRIVKNKDQILIDPRGDLPGRGAYLCPDDRCINQAEKQGILKEELKTSIPEDFYNDILEEIGNE